jgi:hypothetical protein
MGVRETCQFLDDGGVIVQTSRVIVQSGNVLAKVHIIGWDSAIEELIFLFRQQAHPISRIAGGPAGDPEEQT